jgi:hypothetical protein
MFKRVKLAVGTVSSLFSSLDDLPFSSCVMTDLKMDLFVIYALIS